MMRSPTLTVLVVLCLVGAALSGCSSSGGGGKVTGSEEAVPESEVETPAMGPRV